MSNVSSQNSSDPQINAARFLSASHLHQRLWVPATSEHARLRVTFATTSNFDDAAAPVILFAGPMYGTRYFAAMLDHISREIGVRVICVDRPGLGGATPVPIDQRVAVWLETVPLLLAQLRVAHVALVAHSAGTVYALNTLARLRHLLDPRAPYVAFLGPWVHQEHSGAALWRLVGSLPRDVIARMDELNAFVTRRVAPMTAWSGGVLASTGRLFRPKAQACSVVQGSDGDEGQGAADRCPVYGTDLATARQIDKLYVEYFALEQTAGANDEALLLLKKGARDRWAACEDYMAFARAFATDEAASRRNGDGGAAKLRLRVFFAASDIMIGSAGAEYFSGVWAQDGVRDALDVRIHHCVGTDHDSVLVDFDAGGIRRAFEEIKQILA